MSRVFPSRYFYGWAVVAALSVAGGFTMGIGIGNFSFFVEPMGQELEVGRAPFGWAVTARLVGFALSGPLIGRMIDRHGVRVPLAIAFGLLGVAAAGISLVNAAWQMIGLLFFMGLLGFWGSSTLYFAVPVAKWFIRKRGRALSLVVLGFPVGIGISGPVTQAIINAAGWRAAWAIVALTGTAVVLLLCWLVVRNSPEEMGLLPDGETRPLGGRLGDRSAPVAQEESWAVRDALRSATFWRLAIAFGTVLLAMGALGLFWVPYYTSRGFADQTVAWAFSAQAFSQVFAAGALGVVVDRFQPRFLAMAAFVMLMASFGLAMSATLPWHMFLAGFLSGGGIGAAMLLQAHMWPQYFGRRYIGSIRGLALPVTLTFSAAGSAATGVIFDASGSYFPAWWMAIAALGLGVSLLALTPRPRRGAEAASASLLHP